MTHYVDEDAECHSNALCGMLLAVLLSLPLWALVVWLVREMTT